MSLNTNTENTDGKHTSASSSSVPLPKKSFFRKKSLKDYVTQELTRGYILELEEERYAARREKVYTFMSIPRELEKLMAYGFFQCSDAFLFVFTFLPLRCLIVIVTLLQKMFQNLIQFKFPIRTFRNYFKPAEKCDLIKLFIFLTCAYIFSYIDTSVLYHVIKSQSVIKLYIFFNMLEVGDRLFASFVQDTLDALFLTATEKSDKKSQMGVTAHLLLTLASVFGHALVLLLQGTTLSVAINANNRALLTVMMSNNFVELKGAVFKKFDKINLFQVSCSDVRERFHLCILLLVVCVQTMREYSWEESRFWVLFPDCVMVLIAEIGVDWLKHAFITRFNEIPSQVYREYTLSLAYDLAQTKQRRAFSDHSDMVGRRLGFVPLPLAIVLARVVRPSLKGPVVATTFLALLVYIALSSFRLLGSIILLGKACDLIDQHKKETTTPQHTNLPTTQTFPASDSKVGTMAGLSSIVDRKMTMTNNDADILSKFKTSSQPTTRTPSPSRINLINFNHETSQQLYNNSDTKSNVFSSDESSNNSPFSTMLEFIQQPQQTNGQANKYSPNMAKRPFYQPTNGSRKMRGEKKHYYRSFSASHTPRPSIAGSAFFDGGLPSLGEAPGLPDAASASLLMANSAVSILSVSLNEEMLRAAVNANSEKNGGVCQPSLLMDPLSSTASLPCPAEGRDDSTDNSSNSLPKGHSRKHSLGSNIETEFPTTSSSIIQPTTSGSEKVKFQINGDEDEDNDDDDSLTGGKASSVNVLKSSCSKENIRDINSSFLYSSNINIQQQQPPLPLQQRPIGVTTPIATVDHAGGDSVTEDVSSVDLDQTLTQVDFELDKENTASSNTTSSTTTSAVEDSSGESKEGVKQRKKKGLVSGWFSSH